jgi:DNA-binding winged helix-turn-helix (wHTH) protein
MNAGVYEFGPFRLDAPNRELLRGADAIGLTPKVVDVLLELVTHHGQLVLKDDLLRAVWPDTHVTEANLTQAVFVLRKALGDAGPNHRFIATIAGRGYRFVADVRVIPIAAAAGALPAFVDGTPHRAGGRRRPGAHDLGRHGAAVGPR